MRIDVSDLMHDPDVASKFHVVRTLGAWEKGRFILKEPVTLVFYGPVQPASVKELEQMPEGDRQKGVMKFFCRAPRELFVTRDNLEEAGASDEIIWRGDRYKIIQLMPWNHAGWMRAFGYRKEVDDGDGQSNAG